jgi:peptide/nickel transport system substrate-binding protein
MEAPMNDAWSMTRRALFGGAAALATVSLTRPGQAAATRGGRMIYARYADSLQLDPVWTDANVDIWVSSSIYDTLLLPTTPDGLGVRPGLATAWPLSDGGKTVTLTLREGVKFSDGTPLKASDVKFSLDRARDPKNGAWNGMLASIDSITATEPGTVVLKLKQPDPTLIPALAMFNTGIFCQAKYEATPAKDEKERAEKFAEHPLGTGPFLLAEWSRNTRMVFKRNPYYWDKAPDGKPLPLLDEIEFQIIPDDSTRLLKLKAGEIDGTEFIPYSRVKELQADSNLRMELWPSTRVSMLGMFCGEKLKDGTANPLSNQKFRQALNYAVNKEAIIAITTQGLGKPLSTFMSSVTPLAITGKPAYPFDLAKAKALMAESGVPQGTTLACMVLAGNQDNLNNVTAVQQMWAQIGVKLNLVQLDNPTKVARYRAEDYQINTSGWTDDIADPSEIAAYYAYFPTVHNLHSQWQDKRVNELFEASQKEIDGDGRRAQYKELQERYIEAAPIIFLYEVPYPVAFRKNVHGFVQIPLGNNYFEAAYVER